MATKAQIKFTYEDYKSLPESETKRYELVGGELVMVPSPDPEHQDIVGNLFTALSVHVRRHRLGKVYLAPLDVVLGEGEEAEVVQPDLLYISPQPGKISSLRKRSVALQIWWSRSSRPPRRNATAR
jgi:Uma2 family endonuclease